MFCFPKLNFCSSLMLFKSFSSSSISCLVLVIPSNTLEKSFFSLIPLNYTSKENPNSILQSLMKKEKTGCFPLISNGWGDWVRTSASRIQSPMPYRLATPQCATIILLKDSLLASYFLTSISLISTSRASMAFGEASIFFGEDDFITVLRGLFGRDGSESWNFP